MDLRTFIQEHREDFNNKKFTKIYKEILEINQKTTFDKRIPLKELTQKLYNLGINPLLYFKKVPKMFAYRADVEKITIPGNVSQLDNSSFSECTAKSVEIDSGLEYIGFEAFSDCPNLKSVSLPGSLISIGQNAFKGCESLEEIAVPDSVIRVNIGAFRDCAHLKKCRLSKNLTVINDTMFMGDISLESVDMPDTLTEIKDHAFRDCVSLKSIEIPEGTRKLGTMVFYDCIKLRTVVLPNSLTFLDIQAFGNCVELEKITYKGTMAQWKSIRKSRTWDDGSVIGQIVCTDGILNIYKRLITGGYDNVEHRNFK